MGKNQKTAPTTLPELKARLEQDSIEYLLAQFVNIHGSAKVKMVPARSVDAVVNDGAGFAGGAVWGMGQGPHSHDLMGRGDPRSYTPLPWEKGLARLACDIYVDNEPHPHCSRVNLKQTLEDLRREGYVFNVGMEPEFFLVRRNPDGSISIFDDQGVDTMDKPCYDFKGISQALPILREINDYVDQLGWGLYQTDHEDGNGQYEINFDYADALTTADRYTFFKMMSSQVAQKHGCIATHMPKPFSDQTGSGAHFHFHLADARTGKNLFTADGDDPRGLGLSELAYHFIAGILQHARALCAVTSPTVNCYKRLQVGAALTGSRSGYTWTPAFITYGDNNRTQMLRCPGPDRFEDRTISAGCNPYLALAAYVAAGMDGVRKKLDPGPTNLGENLYALSPEEIQRRGIKILPQSLYEALEELKADTVVQGALGPISAEFLELKEGEWRQYHRLVSQWEIDQYLTMF
ncbi:MAG: type III glutamate--ammonia ligase [Anaerolineales bacterium]|nr:MAG: type III glutamate--ammonia ligase [Anaerolineales bacterium]